MRTEHHAPIGVIDSGVGGLTVVKEMIASMPNEPIVYIGDDARCPYGDRPVGEVKAFTMQMAEALHTMGIKMLVVACNTATAVAMDMLQAAFPFPVIGVIGPGARAAVRHSDKQKVLILGTEGTVRSGAYEKAIRRLSPETEVFALPCPAFVPLVERGDYKKKDISPVIQETFEPLRNLQFDTAILGCTHYPLLYDQIRAQLPKETVIVSSAEETVSDVRRVLSVSGLSADESNISQPVFYTTGDVGSFKNVAHDWLQLENVDVRPIRL